MGLVASPSVHCTCFLACLLAHYKVSNMNIFTLTLHAYVHTLTCYSTNPTVSSQLGKYIYVSAAIWFMWGTGG